jgi:hypothetical protein
MPVNLLLRRTTYADFHAVVPNRYRSAVSESSDKLLAVPEKSAAKRGLPFSDKLD